MFYFFIILALGFGLPAVASARVFSFFPPSHADITAAIRVASEKTGVRSAVLYGLLGQETAYGRNVGKTAAEWSALCTNAQGPDCRRWQKYDCKPAYDNARHLDDILRELGITDSAGNADRSRIPTSSTCALGLAQFEPNTWWTTFSLRKDRVYDPWHAADAALAAAFYLRDLGADSSDVLRADEVIGAKDRVALQKYYCGAYYGRAECVAYANGVEQKSRRAETDLLRFDLEQQLRRLREIPPPTPPPAARREPMPAVLAEVTISAPESDALLSSPVTMRAAVSGKADIGRVTFVVDGESQKRIEATDREAPYEATVVLDPGTHAAYAEAVDSASRTYRSPVRRFTVSGIVERSAPFQRAALRSSAPPPIVSVETPRIAESRPVDLADGIAGKPYEAVLPPPSESAKVERWEIVTGAGNTFPPGLALDQKSGKISGTPHESGVWIFNAYAADADGKTQVALFRMEIEAALIITTMVLPDGKAGKPYAGTLAASVAGRPPYLWEVHDGVRVFPSGLTLDPQTGRISGAPTEAGIWFFTVILTDARGSRATRELRIIVSPAIAITTEKLPEGFMGEQYRVTLTAESDAAPIIWSIPRANETFPSGFELDPKRGVISGAPTALGQWNFLVEAEDSAGGKAQKTLTLRVVKPFTISTKAFGPGTVGTHFAAELVAENGTPPYTWRLVSGNLPHGFLFESDIGLISGMPDEAGVSSLTVEVEDAEGRRASRSFTIEIRSAPPVVTGTSTSRGLPLWRSAVAAIRHALGFLLGE